MLRRLYIVVNKWIHVGISSNSLLVTEIDTGYAYDPTEILSTPNGIVNHWNKLERPNVYRKWACWR